MQACIWHPGAPAQEGEGIRDPQSDTQCLLMAREGVCR